MHQTRVCLLVLFSLVFLFFFAESGCYIMCIFHVCSPSYTSLVLLFCGPCSPLPFTAIFIEVLYALKHALCVRVCPHFAFSPLHNGPCFFAVLGVCPRLQMVVCHSCCVLPVPQATIMFPHTHPLPYVSTMNMHGHP